jgi:phage repressor protein C with HTH and peptisase S24 domain
MIGACMTQDDTIKQFVAFLNHEISKIPKKHGYKTVLAKAIGVTPNNFTRILRNDYGKLPINAYNILAQHFGVTLDEAITTGQALLENQDLPTFNDNFPETYNILDKKSFLVPYSEEISIVVQNNGTVSAELIKTTKLSVSIDVPLLKKHSPDKLLALKVNDDSMEPVLTKEGIILVDLSDTALDRLKKPTIYLLCHDLKSGQCEIRYLSWATPELLAIESEQKVEFPTVYKTYNEVHIVGRVIWTSREF